MFRSPAELARGLAPWARIDGSVAVDDERAFRERAVDGLVRTAVFAGDAATRDAARWTLRAAADALGARTASIQGLYDAFAARAVRGFTVPAYNLRGLTYQTARAIFRAARALDAGAFIIEISRSEMGYGLVGPEEFSACVLGAALREGWTGPVFLQGDHFQFPAREYFRDPEKAAAEIRELTAEAIEAGFLNIDIDPSTLVVPDRPTLRERQRDNFERSAEMTEFIRRRQPPGVEISVGAELGEVGKANSTVEEFDTWFEGYRERWSGKPVSKMSVQSGTAHGGVVLSDGSRAEAKLDFAVLRDISAACRKRGLAGTVQHGASTLPESLFPKFPEHDAVEIHLATELQKVVFDHPAFPAELRARMGRWIGETRPPEWRAEATPAQNFEKGAKRAWGPFKRELWDLPSEVLGPIAEALERKFAAFFSLLGVQGTRGAVAAHVRPVPLVPPKPAGL
jgi:fructose/tagatose bisphosphate aldolase